MKKSTYHDIRSSLITFSPFHRLINQSRNLERVGIHPTIVHTNWNLVCVLVTTPNGVRQLYPVSHNKKKQINDKWPNVPWTIVVLGRWNLIQWDKYIWWLFYFTFIQPTLMGTFSLVSVYPKFLNCLDWWSISVVIVLSTCTTTISNPSEIC